jgi:polyphenol oxidase
MTPADLIVPDWPAPKGIHAAFTLRTGGVSRTPYDSLNVGTHVGDEPSAVTENRLRIREALTLPAEPTWLEQVHGTDVAMLDGLIGKRATAAVAHPSVANAQSTQRSRSDDATAPRTAGAAQTRVNAPRFTYLRADAAVTHSTGCVCVIQVADCMPVLFAARDGSAVGAAHAGWRGLAGGVLEATVQALAIEPSQLIAWMGPAIGPKHFEVGDEVREAFITHDTQASAAFTLNERGRWQCDLYFLARRRLEALGIHSVAGGGWCTYEDTSRFFSYRREGRCGRMAALIWRT